jgi:hypothetical protein
MLSSEISEKPLCGLEIVRFHNTTLRARNSFVATLATLGLIQESATTCNLGDFLLGEEE